ncbi:transposable element Tcb2 transposase [Trichonephila clavipes]|nr:transposable element Tcb2 transposase [Trichonephila clavipes]
MPPRLNKEKLQQRGERVRPSRRRSFLLRNRSLCAAKRFYSDASLKAVERGSLNNSKNWHRMTEGDVSARSSTTASQDVAREFNFAYSVVSRLWKSIKTTGMCSRRHGGVRVRSNDACRRQIYCPISKRNRRTTAQQHRTARLQWCREHHNWTEQDWACVLFLDESRFSLSSDCRRQLICRESGTAYRPENIQEEDQYPTCSIMVWAGIMINGRTRLHVVANGNLTGQQYIDEVLLPHVRLFRGAVGDKFVFMDVNATYHRTLAVQDCLDSKGNSTSRMASAFSRSKPH